jgi:hypothetical protein
MNLRLSWKEYLSSRWINVWETLTFSFFYPPREITLFRFSKAEEVSQIWTTETDEVNGGNNLTFFLTAGSSEANITLVSEGNKRFAWFKGQIVPQMNGEDLYGFTALVSKPYITPFGSDFKFDLTMFQGIMMRVFGDGNTYCMNIYSSGQIFTRTTNDFHTVTFETRKGWQIIQVKGYYKGDIDSIP